MSVRKRKTVALGFGVAALGVLSIGAYLWVQYERDERARHHNNLGTALLEASIDIRKQDLSADAVKEIQAALRERPAFRPARINLALAAFRQRDLGLARSTLERLLEDNPDDLQAHFILGLVHHEQNGYTQASRHFQRVLKHDPEEYHALYYLAQALVKEKRPSEAIQYLRLAVSKAPLFRPAHYHLVRALGAVGLEEEAKLQLARFEKVVTPPVAESFEPMIFGSRGEPIGDSRSVHERPDPEPRYTDVTHEVGLSFPGASSPGKDVERALRGEAMPRAWFLSAENRSRLAAPFASGSAFLDYDADGRLDAFLVGPGSRQALFAQDRSGRFADATDKAGLGSAIFDASCATAGDYDNDGLVDLLVAGRGGARLYRNTAGGNFAYATTVSGLAVVLPPGAWCAGASFADLDHDGDLDIYCVCVVDVERAPEKPALRFPDDFEAQPNLVFQNSGVGTFKEIGREAHPANRPGRCRAVWCTDHDGDRIVDIVLYDLYGQAEVHRNARDGTFAPSDTAGGSLPPLPPLGESRSLGDFNGDGAPDLLVNRSSTGAALFRNDNVPSRWLTVRARGNRKLHQVFSNRLATGALVEVRSTGMWQRKEQRAGSASWGSDAPEVYFDLGSTRELDYVRAIFPSTARTAVKEVKANQAIEVEEPLLVGTSCPWVFSWSGERFEFIADTISAGVLGELIGPGRYWDPDPEEWLRIPGESLAAKGGFLELRFVNALEEVTYLDRARLLAVDHPPESEVQSSERMATDPATRAPARLYLIANLRPIARATDHVGRDATESLARVDRVYHESFRLLPFEGFAEDWSLTLDLGPRPGTILLLHGWTSWNSTASAIAAAQAGRTLRGPSLDVQDAAGVWREALADLGVPAGLRRTMAVDLRGVLRSGEHVVRIRTNRMVYFDQASTADELGSLDPAAPGSPSGWRTAEAPLQRAELRWLGYPRRVLPGGRLPESPDYQDIVPDAEWRSHAGFLTKPGEVVQLLRAADDRFVVMGHGEEVALQFSAAGLPPLPEGWKRTYFLESRGYEKGIDWRYPHGATVEPYPFAGPEGGPCLEAPAELDLDRLEYLLEWNTRPGFVRPKG